MKKKEFIQALDELLSKEARESQIWCDSVRGQWLWVEYLAEVWVCVYADMQSHAA